MVEDNVKINSKKAVTSPIGVIHFQTRCGVDRFIREQFPSPIGVIHFQTEVAWKEIEKNDIEFPSPIGVIHFQTTSTFHV